MSFHAQLNYHLIHEFFQISQSELISLLQAPINCLCLFGPLYIILLGEVQLSVCMLMFPFDSRLLGIACPN